MPTNAEISLRGGQVVSSLPFAFPASIHPFIVLLYSGGEERCAVTCGLSFHLEYWVLWE